MPSPELLSPAKDLEQGIIAINSGADAVYIGASTFGARKAAGNSLEDISKLIAYAHKFYAKVYVTVNTILYEEELAQVEKLIHSLYNIGCDAIIIQDTGILEMKLPSIPIFSSTQMHNCTIEKLKFYERIGIKRAILARELSMNELAEIRKITNIELEVFVHGALCVSYSGQCYISHQLTGRSGNRGECSQICRTPFTLIDGNGKEIIKNKHLLSIKDLNLSDNIEKMLDLGINSFKIEGRLKDAAYVKNITAYYRKIIDNIIENKPLQKRASSGKTKIFFEPDPDKTFNRTYTDYNISGKKHSFNTFETPKSKGKYIGIVKFDTGKGYQIESSEKISNGDGICYISENGTLEGFKVNQAVSLIIYPDKYSEIKSGTELYRNFDQKFSNELKSENTSRKISATISISEYSNGFELTTTDEDNNSVLVNIETTKESANNPEKALENIKTQLGKSGNTIFEISDVTINFTTAYFLQIKSLNEARRELLEKLEIERLKNYPIIKGEILKNNFPFPEKELNYSANISNSLAIEFYKRHGTKIVQKSVETGEIPEDINLMTTKYCIKFELGLCEKYQKPTEKRTELFLKNLNNKFALEFDCGNCLMKVKNI
ncbi:MAG: hypothetical protein A2033_19240 [Bacteroidetes bacterium GWA2_31_9]|nr:MAG: hypothetical protein A2033_19240 [Bacteroidetes bacterium GWA2_31_9]